MTSSDPYSIAIRNAFQGVKLPFTVTFYDTPPDPNAQPPVVGVPHNVSGWRLSFTMKKNLEDPDTVPTTVFKLDWSIAAGAGTNGQITWTIPAASMSLIEAKFLYYWDLARAVTGDTDPSMLSAGTVYVNPTVGQRAIP